jgi:hypothetical protein
VARRVEAAEHLLPTRPGRLALGLLAARRANGQVVGQTNENGAAIEGKAYQVNDLFATIFAAMGFNPKKEFRTEFGSMAKATDDGEPIAELL